LGVRVPPWVLNFAILTSLSLLEMCPLLASDGGGLIKRMQFIFLIFTKRYKVVVHHFE
jgi:hypothetical protein